MECLCTESFPTRIRSTGSSVCKASGRAFGFLVQFIYGPLISSKRFSFALGLASSISLVGVFIAYQTTDTLNANLNDHWEPSTKQDDDDTQHTKQHAKQSRRASIAKKYFAIEV